METMLMKLFWLIIGSLLLLLRFDCNGYYYKTRIPQRLYYQFLPKLTNSISNKDYKVYEDQMDDYEMISHFQRVPNFSKEKPLQFASTPSYYDKYLQQIQNSPSYHFTKMTNLWTNKRPNINHNYYTQHTTPVNFKYTSIPEADSYNLPIKHQELTNLKENSYNFEAIKEISPPSASWNNQLINNYRVNPMEISNFVGTKYNPPYDLNQNNYDNKEIVYDDSYNYKHINAKPIIDQNFDYNINQTSVQTTNNQPDKTQYYHNFSNDQNLVNINSNNNVDSKITETIKTQQQPVINQDLNANFEDKDHKVLNVNYNQPLKTETLPDYHRKPIETSNLKRNNKKFKTNNTKPTEITKTKPPINQNILDADIKDDNIETYVYSKFEPMRLTKKKNLNTQRRASIKRQIPIDYIIYIIEKVLE